MPSLVPGEKRLAVHVEDHPLEYGDFEGTIPKGEYGGGTVIVWDRGTWEPIGDKAKGLAKGQLDFELHGEKLHGRWHLVRMARQAPREARELAADQGRRRIRARGGDPDILDERPESVKTGRDIEESKDEEPGWSSKTGKIDKPGQTKPGRAKAGQPRKRRRPATDDPPARRPRSAGAQGRAQGEACRISSRLSWRR